MFDLAWSIHRKYRPNKMRHTLTPSSNHCKFQIVPHATSSIFHTRFLSTDLSGSIPSANAAFCLHLSGFFFYVWALWSKSFFELVLRLVLLSQIFGYVQKLRVLLFLFSLTVKARATSPLAPLFFISSYPQSKMKLRERTHALWEIRSFLRL